MFKEDEIGQTHFCEACEMLARGLVVDKKDHTCGQTHSFLDKDWVSDCCGSSMSEVKNGGISPFKCNYCGKRCQPKQLKNQGLEIHKLGKTMNASKGIKIMPKMRTEEALQDILPVGKTIAKNGEPLDKVEDINKKECCEKCFAFSNSILGRGCYNSNCPCHSPQDIIKEFRKQFGEDDPIVADKKDIEQFILKKVEEIEIKHSAVCNKAITLAIEEAREDGITAGIDLVKATYEANKEEWEKKATEEVKKELREKAEEMKTDGSNQLFSNRNLNYSDGYNQAIEDILKLIN